MCVMEKDSLFEDLVFKEGGFCFDEQVVGVFDDMIRRSVPFYGQLQQMILSVIRPFFDEGNGFQVTDLGCSTGAFLQALLSSNKDYMDKQGGVSYTGVDNSGPMLAVLKERFLGNTALSCRFVQQDLNVDFSVPRSDVIVLNLLLQFLDVVSRGPLLRACYTSLNPGGMLFLVEKVIHDDAVLDACFVREYHGFKRRNGYSDAEIVNKDKALKQVLRPLSVSDNSALLIDAGFSHVAPFFQCFNFVGILAIK